MQHSDDKFTEVCNNSGLTISIQKTEVMHQPAPRKIYVKPNITINGQQLHTVDKFTYLGCALLKNTDTDDEVNARLAKASAASGRHHKNMWITKKHHPGDKDQGEQGHSSHHPLRL